MKKDINSVKKIVSSYLELEHVHNGFKLVKMKDETVSVYDGTYPSIELIYESSGNNLWLRQQRGELIQGIERYTGLRHNTDFWLGVGVV